MPAASCVPTALRWRSQPLVGACVGLSLHSIFFFRFESSQHHDNAMVSRHSYRTIFLVSSECNDFTNRTQCACHFCEENKMCVNQKLARHNDVDPDRSFEHLRKLESHRRVQICLWLIWHNVIVTKNNMIKKIGQVTLCVAFSQNLRVSTMYSLDLLLQNMLGILSADTFVSATCLVFSINIFGGFPISCQVGETR